MKNSTSNTQAVPDKAKISNRKLRRDLRSKGLHVCIFFWPAVILAFFLSRANMEVYWIFAEPHGFMVMNLDDSERINKGRAKNNISKLRVRDLNRMAIFRTPKKTWGIIKKHSK